jgi:hypothetical protein
MIGKVMKRMVHMLCIPHGYDLIVHIYHRPLGT